MDDMVLLAAILVIGPFVFFVIMVCILKIVAYLNMDVLKTGTTQTTTTLNVENSQPSNVHRYVFDNCIETADLNEPYLYGDRWMTGLSIAAHLPIRIALSDIPLSTPNTISQISAQSPVTTTSISSARHNTDTPSLVIMREDDTRSLFSEPPPDYNLARRLLEFQRAHQPTPPPSYGECVQ